MNRVSRATALLLTVCASRVLSAQSPRRGGNDEPWSGRLAVGLSQQDSYAYASPAFVLGGTVGRALGERTVLRLDVSHARYGPRIDLTGCSGMWLGGTCTGTARASDKLDQWLVSVSVEQRLEQVGFYVLAGLASSYTRGRALGHPGVAAGGTVGLGLRFGETFAVEARLIELVGVTRREGWFVPLVVSLGP